MAVALKILVAFACIAIVHPLKTTNEKMCEILPPKSTFRDLDSCDSYYICENGMVAEGRCLEGLFYDKDSGKCINKNNVKCELDMDQKCDGRHSVYLSDPLNCENYYICMNGKAKLSSCPAGVNFNPKTLSCDYEKVHECTIRRETNMDICTLISEKLLFENPKDCSKYRMCVKGKVTEATCPGGFLFNKQIGRCDEPKNVQCKPSGKPVEKEEAPEVRMICGTNSKPIVGLVTDSKTCRGYYKCISKIDKKTGKQIVDESPAHFECDKSEIFDKKHGKCGPRGSTFCTFNRCEGWDNKYINIENDGCTGYILCQNGEELLQMECPENQYFDEDKQTCSTEKVQKPICAKTN